MGPTVVQKCACLLWRTSEKGRAGGAGNYAEVGNNSKSLVTRAGACQEGQGVEVGRRMAGSSSDVVSGVVVAAITAATRPRWRAGGCRRIRTLMTGSERVGSLCYYVYV